ncbi:MAG: DHH family phosphoesterase [Candidatus Thermoplasmatota archaeon]|nr:DHH family phosphoesterase [Candidatus Thermoplasmatota archaeon]MBS3789690.1 DHH family phosphoesterase [Candidatus Thermoplasmatota archaeon]
MRYARVVKEKAKRLAQKIQCYDKIQIVSHIDADGITSASIAHKALERADKDIDVKFIKQLDENEIDTLKDRENGLIWFTDLGSGQLKGLEDIDCIITDHHEPQGKTGPPSLAERENILSYGNSDILELNPHRYGLDGAKELSGSGTTYLVAKEMDKSNKDLSKLAVIGAVGDLQAAENNELIGKNREILKEGIETGVVDKKIETTLYGIESRPLPKLLEYASDPVLPGLTGEESACTNFLVENDIPLKEGETWRRWYDLSKEEKRSILSGLAKRMLDRGYPVEYAESLVGEVYEFPDEERGTMLHEAKEFSTLLNSCGRYEKGDIGLKVCLGDREKNLKKARSLLKGHQKVLVDSLQYVENIGVEEREHLQFFHGKDEIPDTVVGTVAGMLLSSGDVERRLPIIAFAKSEERDGVKVSSRGTKRLVKKGLDLSSIMSKCSKKVGGEGGGHDIAAGALIPDGKEEEFLGEVEDMIESQLQG